MDLFDQVLHAFESHVPKKSMVRHDDGTSKTINWNHPWLDHWISIPNHRSTLTAIQLLAVILLEARQRKGIDLDREQQIVRQWTTALRSAVTTGQLKTRDLETSLPLDVVPDGWDWCITSTDADMWLADQGIGWTCREILGNLHSSILNSQMPPIQCYDESNEVPECWPVGDNKREGDSRDMTSAARAGTDDAVRASNIGIPHKRGAKWVESELRALLDASSIGTTQKALATFHCVTRQVIGIQIRTARDQFGTKPKTDLSANPFATLVNFRNKK